MTRSRITRHLVCFCFAAMLVTASCGSSDDTTSEIPGDTAALPDSTAAGGDSAALVDSSGPFPDVIAAESEQAADGSWTFSVTLSSPYDSPEQYADAWRIIGPDGTELGYRGLTHDHANEQPFTRSQNGIVIPEDIDTVTIQGRDLINGWGGAILEHDLTR